MALPLWRRNLAGWVFDGAPLRRQLLARYRRAFSISGRRSPEPAHSRAAVVRDARSGEYCALGSARLKQSLQRLTDNSIAYMNFDEAVVSVDLYDAILEINANATWNWTPRAC
jgi:hypothetical protein